jgi:hypothetical protein
LSELLAAGGAAVDPAAPATAGWRPAALCGGAAALLGTALLLLNAEQLGALLVPQLSRMALLALVYPVVLMPLRSRLRGSQAAPGDWATLFALTVLTFAWTVLIEMVCSVGFHFARFRSAERLDEMMAGGPVVVWFTAVLTLLAGLGELSLTTRSRARAIQLRTARMQASDRVARLQLLQWQLHPHFLFNALQGASSLLATDPARAEDLLGRLQRLYRSSLRLLHDPVVPLAQEIAWAREYLDIERERFADRLEFEIDVPPGLADETVPPLILQPLVENAVRHGVSREVGGAWIAITAAESPGTLQLRVANGTRRAVRVRHGFGLRHTLRRLREAYGAEARLEVEQRPGELAVVLYLPSAGSTAARSKPRRGLPAWMPKT